MMDFESIVEWAAFHRALAVTMEDMTSQFPVDRPRSASQIKWLALPDEANQVDVPITDDLFERSGSQTFSGQHSDPGLPTRFGGSTSVDDYRNVDRRGF